MADEHKPSELALSTFSQNSTMIDENQIEVDHLNSTMIDENQIEVERLVIGRRINEGRYANVYKGEYKSMPVAVKATHALCREAKEKFDREVSALSKVNHDNIVRFVGATADPNMMILTEFVPGGTLQRHMWSVRPRRLDIRVAIGFAIDISRAVDYLHQNGIIHRYLKLSNLLLTGDKKSIKLIDFGLSIEEPDDEVVTNAETYRWMAPELFCKEVLHKSEKGRYDHKVDVYSFAMILFELLSNKKPFKDKNDIMAAYAAVMNRRPSLEEIPEQIAPLLQSCWSENPDNRPEFWQITQFLQDLLDSICMMYGDSPREVAVASSLLEEERSGITEPEKEDDAHASDSSAKRRRGAKKKKSSRNLFVKFVRFFGGCF